MIIAALQTGGEISGEKGDILVFQLPRSHEPFRVENSNVSFLPLFAGVGLWLCVIPG